MRASTDPLNVAFLDLPRSRSAEDVAYAHLHLVPDVSLPACWPMCVDRTCTLVFVSCTSRGLPLDVEWLEQIQPSKTRGFMACWRSR